MMIVGRDALSRSDGQAILTTARNIASTYKLVNAENGWNGFNVLHRSQGEINALELGIDFKPISSSAKVIFLLGCDNNILPSDIPKDAFVVYIVAITLFRDLMETKELNTQTSSFPQLLTLKDQAPTVLHL
jgi:hypothetical protein